MILRAENETLKNENYRLQAALRNIICPNCGGPCIMGADLGLDDHQLRLENARLREEVLFRYYYNLFELKNSLKNHAG